jgi:FtsH-binding integral membrane protein
LYSTNPVPRIISYGSLISGMGILMIPMFIAFPDSIIPAFVTSSSVFGGAVVYALTRKTQELSIWGPTLYSCLFGLTGVSLLGLGSSLLIGQNLFASSAHLISLYGGIPLFTGLIAYDTYKAIQMYRLGEPDHLGCSVDLYLSFINLFVRLVEIIAKIQALTNYNNKDDDKDK